MKLSEYGSKIIIRLTDGDHIIAYVVAPPLILLGMPSDDYIKAYVHRMYSHISYKEIYCSIMKHGQRINGKLIEI